MQNENNQTSVQQFLWFIPRYTRGRVLQVLKGIEQPLYEHFIWQPTHVNDTSLYASKSFDAVVIGEYLDEGEHYKKDDLLEYWRILKDEGHLVITTNLSQAAIFDELSYLNKLTLVDQDETLLTFVFRKTKNLAPALNHRKTVCICRLGARGDNLIASSVIKGFKDLDYHVTFMGSPPGIDVLENDPHIDDFHILDVDQVPNTSLSKFWEFQKKRYDKFVNLSETIEMQFLSGKDRTLWRSPPALRESLTDYNYLQFAHEMAGLEYKNQVKFYPTTEETHFVFKEMIGKKQIIVFCVGGSSLHKEIPYQDILIATVLHDYKNAEVYLIGGKEDLESVEKWNATKRVHIHCGDWTFRQSLAFACKADLVLGPETGVMVGIQNEDCHKIVYLSHSTKTNLTRDWNNTDSLSSDVCECFGRGNNESKACHLLLMNDDGKEVCNPDPKTNLARCMHNITPDKSWIYINTILNEKSRH
jgi:hypothetical protein